MEGKMKKKIFSFIIFVTVVSGFALRNPFALDAVEIEQKKTEALLGDTLAADELASYYTFELGKNFNDYEIKKQVDYWSSIAAENDPSGFCQYNYYLLIVTNGYKLDDEKRGSFWLCKSARLGCSYAKNYLEYASEEVLDFEKIENHSDREMNEDNLDFYKALALYGSGRSASILSEYFKRLGEHESEKYWTRIGAQNEDIDCIKKLISILEGSNDNSDKLRAEFWKRKLVELSVVN